MSNIKEKQTKISSIIFIVAILAITIFFATFIITSIAKPFVIDEMSDIKEVSVENYKTKDKNGGEYYVLVYNLNTEKDKEIEEMVIQYADYARMNSDARPIYILDYQENEAIANADNLNVTSSNLQSQFPMLVLIKNSGVSTDVKKTTVSTILQELSDNMK